MKRYFGILICLVFIYSLNAQSLSLSNESGSISNNSNVYVVGSSFDIELFSEITFTNNGTETIEVCVKKTEIELVPGTINIFAFGGMVFPPMIYQSPYSVSTSPGESNSDFASFFQPNETSGESTIRYTFFDYNNPTDSICVNVFYVVNEEDDDPIITSIVPDQATIPESLTVDISGADTHFTMGSGTLVWFSQASSTIFPVSVNEVNNTTLLAQFLFTNIHTPGDYDVHTHNTIDGHLIMPDGFTLNPNPNPPYLSSISPTAGESGEMITATISAQNTSFTQGVNYAYLYNNYTTIMAHTIDIISDETIVVEFPITSGSPNGLYDLKVKSEWDGYLNLFDAFEVFPDSYPQSLTEIDPDEGTIPETLIVNVSGYGTHFSQATGTIVKLKQGNNNIYSSSVVELNDTELTAQFSFDNFDDPGYYTVEAYNALDGLMYLYDAFYLNPDPNPPHIVSVNPDSAQPGETLDVSISGQNTNFAQGTGTTVWLDMGNNFIYPYNTIVINDELINASFSFNNSTSLGEYDVNTHNGYDGYLELVDGFTIYDETPHILGIDPVSGYVGDEVSLFVFGEYTHFEDASTIDVWLTKNSQIINSVTLNVLNNYDMIADINIPENAEAGFWTVFVTNSIDGDIYLQNAFEIIDTVISVNDNELFKTVNIYPNPTDGKIFISYELNGSDYVSIELCDFYGRSLYKEQLNESTVTRKELAVPTLTSGVYYLRFLSNTNLVSKKIIVK